MKYTLVYNETRVPGNYEGICETLNSDRIDPSNEEVHPKINSYEISRKSPSAKQYRPFSDSINVPPIENPIILNPNYNYVLSAQYATDNVELTNDLEIKRREKEVAVKIILENLKNVQSQRKHKNITSNKVLQKQNYVQAEISETLQNDRLEKNQVLFEKEIRLNQFKADKNSELQSIKMTAFNIIDENIKKAVSVAEQIKKEIDVELTGTKQCVNNRESRSTFYSKPNQKSDDHFKTLGEKKAYLLGVQIIPYMKTYMQSNHFKSILIKQIFLQLTIFMVSLSRRLESTLSDIFIKRERNYEEKNTMDDCFIGEQELNEEKILSGSEMSRKFGKTPLEFTKRMDTVITEFEARTGIEQSSKTQRRSRSRSRGTVNGNFNNQGKSETDGKNTYRAFVTEEWSEYYDLGSEKSKTIKTEKHFESKTIKKETIEKIIDEKITEKELPLTYIAIVQAHVFTNQNAIQDTLHMVEHEENKLTATELLESQEESLTINKKERIASYTDLENQVIKVNKDNPIEKVVIVESIEDITPIEEHKPFAKVESVVTGIAVQKTTEVLEPITEISERPIKSVQAKSSMDISNVVIGSSEAVVIQEEKENSFTLPEVKPKKLNTLFESSLKIVATKSEIDTTEPIVEILEITDVPPVKINTIVEKLVKPIAQISEVQISEAQTQLLQIQTSKEQQLKKIVEPSVQPVAEKFEICVNDSIHELEKNVVKTTTPEFSTQSPVTIIAEIKETFIDEAIGKIEEMKCNQEILKPNVEQLSQTVAEITAPLLDESSGIYIQGKLDIRRPHILIETPIKVVAEISAPSLNDSNGDFVEKLTLTGTSNTAIEGSFKTVANKIDICIDECNLDKLEKLEIKGETTTASVETSFKTVPEISEVSLNEITDIIETPKCYEDNSKILNETPFNTVAEKTELLVDEVEIKNFNSDKITSGISNILIETPIKVVAEKFVIITDAPKPDVFESRELKIETPKTLTEDSLRFLSESIIPAIEEPRIEILKLPKKLDEEVKVVLNKIEPIITTEVFLAEPNQISFEVPEVNIKIPRTLMEDALLTVPETLTTSMQGPKDDILFVSKVAEEYAKLNFRSSEATGVSELLILEPHCDSLEIPQIKQQQYQTSLEKIIMAVPNTEINLALGPKDDILIIPNIVMHNTNLKMNELKALEASEVTSEETIQKALEPFRIDVKQTKVFIEDNVKTVPATTLVRVAESEKIFSILSESVGQVARPAVQPLTALAQSAVIPIEEVRVGANYLETSSNKAKLSLQEFSATNIGEITALSTVKQENFRVAQNLKKVDANVNTSERAKAVVNKIDVKESKLEITEIIDSEDMCEDELVDYSVELVKDDKCNKTSNDEYAKLKIVKKHTVEAQELNDILLKSMKQVTNNKEELLSSAAKDIETKHIQKDKKFLEHQMTSVNSVESDFQSKSVDKKLLIETVSESKLIESESSKSPSPTSPINDVYLFNVATPYTKYETQTEIPCVEFDYRSDAKKQQYTQAEISVEESIAIELQVSDSEEEKESIEMEYEYQKHQFESTSNMSAVVSSHQKEQSLEFDQSVSKQESKRSHVYAGQSKSKQEALQQESKQIHQNKISTVKKSTAAASRSDDIQALEINRKSLQKDITVIESDIESSHALLLTVDASKSKTATSINKDITSEIKQINHEVKSPSPPIQPPTPLTDEYMFRLTAPLLSREGTPVPRDCTSSSESEEDIIKQKLVPHIELTIEQRIFDPPLPTPPNSPPVTSPSTQRRPFYSKPGLRGGGDRLEITKEEDSEIRRKSTLLASAIDKTIRSIEEYKSEVGMETVNVDYQSSSEIVSSSSNESKIVKEFKTLNDDKVGVLIDKIVETSRRFSGEGSQRDDLKSELYDTSLNDNEREFIVPIHQEYLEPTRPEPQSIEIKENIEKIHIMDTNKLSEQLLQSVQSMVDPNASIEERLTQMQAQITELSRLPDIIHRTLDAVKIQFEELNYEMQQKAIAIQMSQNVKNESVEQTQVSDQMIETLPLEQPVIEVTELPEVEKETEESLPDELPTMEVPDMEIQSIIEKRRLEAENKEREEIMKERLSQELRIAAERLSPRLGGEENPELGPQKLLPKCDISGPMAEAKPVSGKIWKKLDNYDDNNLEQILSETLGAQSEVIKGNAIGVNFMKYEKPPPALEHLQNSEVYKAIHDVDQKPLKKVELLRPAIAASDYVQRLRSVSPSPAKTLIEDCEV